MRAGQEHPVEVPSIDTACGPGAQPGDGGSWDLLLRQVPVRRAVVRRGAFVCRADTHLTDLHLVRSGVFKASLVTRDGREKVMALRFGGEWLGFDGIADGRHACDVCAVEPGEVWSVHYESLVRACAREPGLAGLMHRAMSEEMARDREAMRVLSTQSADARVADFLHRWIETLARHGRRTDRFTLRLTRNEIANYLGLTVESVSRSFTRLARERVIGFSEATHREVQVRDAGALVRFLGPLAREGAAC